MDVFPAGSKSVSSGTAGSGEVKSMLNAAALALEDLATAVEGSAGVRKGEDVSRRRRHRAWFNELTFLRRQPLHLPMLWPSPVLAKQVAVEIVEHLARLVAPTSADHGHDQVPFVGSLERVEGLVAAPLPSTIASIVSVIAALGAGPVVVVESKFKAVVVTSEKVVLPRSVGRIEAVRDVIPGGGCNSLDV